MPQPSTAWGAGASPEEYGNPHQVEAVADLAFAPQFDIDRWGETRFMMAYSPASGAGIFYHAGRHLTDLNLWWAHIVAFLPSGELVVDRSSGRLADNSGMATGNFLLKIEEPLRRCSMQFDGAGEITGTATLARHPGGSGGRYVPMQWDIQCEAVGPAWDLFSLPGMKQQTFGSIHTQQGFRTSGSIAVAGKSYSLEGGVAVNDHSCGRRDFTGFGGDNFLVVVMPGMTIHAMKCWKPDDSFMMQAGSLFTRNGEVPLTDFDMPRVGDLLGAPHTAEVKLTKADGSVLSLKAEVLYTTTVTVTADNDNINGVEWEVSENPLVFTMGVAKFTAPDGSVGYGHLERSVRRGKLSRQSLGLKTGL